MTEELPVVTQVISLHVGNVCSFPDPVCPGRQVRTVKAVDEVQQQTDVMRAKIFDLEPTQFLCGADVWPGDKAFSR